jgi:PAS domain S-box-containing protein
MVIRFKAELKSAIVANPLLVSQEMTVLEAIAQMARARIIAMTDGFVASSTASSIAGYTGDMDYVHQEARSTCVLVMEHGQVIGIMTEREVVSFSAQFSHVISHVNPLANVTVGEVMRSPVIMYEDDFNDLSVVAKLLQQNHIRQIIVLDQGDRLLGIVTHESLMQLVRPLDVLLAQRELDLHHSEQRFISLAAAVPVGIFRTDIEGNCIYVNDRWCEISGLSIDEAAGFGWVNAIHPSDRELVTTEWNNSVQEKRHFRLEYRFLNQAGQITWVYGQAVAEHDQAGEIIGYVGTNTDISDRKQTEQKLQELNQELETKVKERTQELWSVNSLQRAILDGADYSFISADLNGIIQTFNAAAERMLGYSASEIVGKDSLAIFHDPQEIIDRSTSLSVELGKDIPVGFEIFVAKTRLGMVNEEEWTYIRKDGSRLPVLLSVTALKDYNQEIIGFLGIAKDISEQKAVLRDRKQAEQEIIDKQRFIQKIADSSPNILYIYDLHENRNVYCNREITDTLGYSPAEIQAMGAAFFSRLMHPDDFAKMPKYYTQIDAAQDGDIFEIEYRMRHANGEWRWLFSRDSVFSRDDRGHVKQTIGTAQDISDRKQSEITLQQTTALLEASNRELEAFAYSVSHDLRSPLRAIDGFSKALLEDYGDKFDDEAKDYFDRIRHNIQRMGMLIDDLLRLSRVSRSEMEYKPVNLSKLVCQQIQELQAIDSDRIVECIIKDEAIVQADPALMAVVINNLCQNAWKFTSHHDTAKIEFGITKQQEQGGQPIYFVRDDGAGFDMDYTNKLFGVFQRLHNTNEFAGTGIGLATVQRAIYRHGGKVWAESAVEQGATFYFTVPT